MSSNTTGLSIGLDIGGSKIAAGLVGDDHTVMARREIITPATAGSQAVLRAATSLAQQLITAAPAGHPVASVGVGSAGAIDPRTRTVLSATNHLRGWAGTDIGAAVERQLGLPVTVDNDARAHAVGEAVAGAGRGCHTVLLAAVGTGIGGAVVLGSVPISGAHGVAGHLGHVPVAEAAGIPCPCGLTGHLESISSGGGLASLYRRRTGDDAVHSAKQVIDAVATDPVAQECVELSAGILGRALAGMAAVIDPDVVIIAGGLSQAGALWWDTVRAAMGASMLPLLRQTPLVPAQLGSDAAIIGSAHLARQQTVAQAGRP